MNKKGQEDYFGVIGGVMAVSVIVILLLLAWAISIVHFDEFAVEKEFGNLYTEFKEPGFTWVGFGSLVRVNNQNRNYEIHVEAASKDLQQINMDLNLNMRIKKEETYEFIKNYQDESIYVLYINNKVQERVKTVVLKYNAEEVLKHRLQLSKELYDEINQIEELSYFTFNDLAIKNVAFSPEFNSMLEKKAQVELERDIIIKQKENLRLLKENMGVMDIDTYFKYKLIEKWNGQSALIISDALLTTQN